MINLISHNGTTPLTRDDILFLQKACNKASEDLEGMIYDLKVYYNGNSELLARLTKEAEEYKKLRIIFEDLEDL